MPSHVIRGALAAAFLAAAAPLAAQGVPQAPTIFEVSPYAGYLAMGSIADGPLGTSLRGANGVLYGGQVGLKVTDNITVYGNLAQSKGDLEVGLPIVGGFDVGQSALLMYDAGLRLSTSLGDRTNLPMRPFVEVGAGGMRYTLGAAGMETTSTSFAGNVGIGADFGLSQGVGIRVTGKDYITRFDVKEAVGFDADPGISHNLAISAGVVIAF